MPLHFVIIVVMLFGFSDVMASLNLGAISGAPLEWAAIGYAAVILLIITGMSRHMLSRSKWYLITCVYYGAIASFAAVKTHYAIVDVSYLLIPILLSIIAFRAIRSEGDALKVCKFIFLSGFISPLIFLVSYLTGSIRIMEGMGFYSAVGMRSASLVSLVVGVFAAGYVIGGSKGNAIRYRRLAVASLIVSLAVILITLSRTALLAVIVCFLFIMIFAASGRQRLLILPLTGIVLAVALSYGPLRDRVMPPQDTTIVDAAQRGDFTSGRALIWETTFVDYLQSPWLGRGTGNAKVFVETHFPTSAGLPHNEYLRLLYDGGLVGLCLIMAALASSYFRAFRLWKKARHRHALDAGVHLGTCLATLALGISAFFENIFLYIFVMGYLFIFFAMSEKLARLSSGHNLESAVIGLLLHDHHQPRGTS